jgi:hypothetical protein
MIFFLFLYFFFYTNIYSINEQNLIDQYFLITTKDDSKNIVIYIENINEKYDFNAFITQCELKINATFRQRLSNNTFPEEQYTINANEIYLIKPLLKFKSQIESDRSKYVIFSIINNYDLNKKNFIRFNKKVKLNFFSLLNNTIETSSHHNMSYNQFYFLHIDDNKYDSIINENTFNNDEIKEDLKNNFPFIIFDKETSLLIEETDAVYTQRNFNDNTTAYQIEECHNSKLIFNPGDRLFIHKNLLLKINKNKNNIERFQKIKYFKSSKNITFDENVIEYTLEKNSETECDVKLINSFLNINNDNDFNETIKNEIIKKSSFVIIIQDETKLKIQGTNNILALQNFTYNVLNCTNEIVLNKNDILYLHKNLTIQSVDRHNNLLFSEEIMINKKDSFRSYLLTKNNSYYCQSKRQFATIIFIKNNNQIKFLKNNNSPESTFTLSMHIKDQNPVRLSYKSNTTLTFNAGDKLYLNGTPVALDKLFIITENKNVPILYIPDISISPCFLNDKKYVINLIGLTSTTINNPQLLQIDYPIIEISNESKPLLSLKNQANNQDISFFKYDTNTQNYSPQNPGTVISPGERFIITHDKIKVIPNPMNSQDNIIFYNIFNKIRAFDVQFTE